MKQKIIVEIEGSCFKRLYGPPEFVEQFEVAEIDRDLQKVDSLTLEEENARFDAEIQSSGLVEFPFVNRDPEWEA